MRIEHSRYIAPKNNISRIKRPAVQDQNTENPAEKFDKDLESFTASHYTKRFENLKSDLLAADETSKDLQPGAPGSIKVETKAPRIDETGVLTQKVIGSSSLSTTDAQVNVDHYVQRDVFGEHSQKEEYRLNQDTGVLTVLKSGIDRTGAFSDQLEIDTNTNTLLNRRRGSELLGASQGSGLNSSQAFEDIHGKMVDLIQNGRTGPELLGASQGTVLNASRAFEDNHDKMVDLIQNGRTGPELLGASQGTVLNASRAFEDNHGKIVDLIQNRSSG